MSFKLSVFNPSDYPRAGHVTIRWQPVHEKTNIPEEELVLKDSSGTSLLFQIDHPDPENSSRDTLSFSFTHPIPPGPDDYSTPQGYVNLMRSQTPEPMKNDKLSISSLPDGNNQIRGITLSNRRLKVWFNLIPGPKDEENTWFAGSASTVEFDGKEILDPFKAEHSWQGHDYEKRCMQIDKLQLCRPPWDSESYQQISFFNRPYKLISQSHGPVRATGTVVSDPFEYSYSDPVTKKKHLLICQLYRIISLYAGADHVIEELFIKTKAHNSNSKKKNTEVIHLRFIAQYFAYMDIGFGEQSQLYQFLPHLPDWFAVSSSLAPYAGYGFATNSHARPVMRPHPNFPDLPNAHKTFSWQLHPCTFAKCLHLFMRTDDHGERWEIFSGIRPKNHDSLTGKRWYEYIFKPLFAEIH